MTETAFLSPADQEAHQAFEAWRAAKLKSDQTMVFTDCRATAMAWARFQDLFVPRDRPEPSSGARVVPFPRRYPDFGGAA